MTKSFYNLDYYIELNEKRDESLRAEDFFAHINIGYFIFLLIFLSLFITSFVFTLRFLYPKTLPSLIPARNYYGNLRRDLEPKHMIDGNIDQPTVDAILKTAYLIELEASIDENLKAVAKKQANYFNAFRYSLFSIFPFVICLIFHNFQDDKPNQVEIVNAGKSRIFVEDTIKVRNVK